MTTTKFAKLSTAFTEYFGRNAIERLQSDVKTPAILIAGHQLTGKSTMAKRLATIYNGGQFYSVGSMFRELASSLNMSVAKQSRLLLDLQLHEQGKWDGSYDIKQNPLYGRRVDIELDYRTCQIVQGIDKQQPRNMYSVIEGRQPALIGNFIQNIYDRENLLKIYVKCNVRDKSIRFLEREVGKECAAIAEQQLPLDLDLDDMAAVVGHLSSLPLPNIDKVVEQFIENQHRDQDDRNRYMELYGLDYEASQFYDFIVDTSNETAANNLRKVTDFIDSLDRDNTVPTSLKNIKPLLGSPRL
ncbi:hypothetical protein SAMD00019534_072490 [Acytostelium subglobosum LB1]|uniref:hypothetical protein n=1 Tax=Acytostelium subglobosum LB1 TaxID=1410327 RepID=UPI000644CC0F|nr:hypothetical protein SAMD00019534_072490 [Acytostelium subglobosum LB1]GAM24074.1 hypothetical protein SAMD00019534_072490 [Acytostelium subglobosum LB1]|eukprot:XP_012753110.1 hypothetical protein SAMD00019534_072490 [Acytostelium subglobosum LB1]